VSFEELGPYTDTDTGKPVANLTRYTYRDGGESYVITFTRHRDLVVTKFIDQLHGPKKSGGQATSARPRKPPRRDTRAPRHRDVR
jgi:hypothetical protein